MRTIASVIACTISRFCWSVRPAYHWIVTFGMRPSSTSSWRGPILHSRRQQGSGNGHEDRPVLHDAGGLRYWTANGRLSATLRPVDVGLHLPLFTALFELTPERDADGDEAHQKDLECHAPSREHPLCQ